VGAFVVWGQVVKVVVVLGGGVEGEGVRLVLGEEEEEEQEYF